MKKLFTIFSLFVLSISFIPKNSYSQNNVVLEYCTGTWCQWCPCGHEIIDAILVNYPNTMVLGYHGAGSDPWQTYSSGIRGLFGFSAYPTGCVGRRSGIISRSGWNNEVVLQTLSIQPGVTITVTNKSYDVGTRTLTATITVTANTNLVGDFYMNYVLTESNLIYSQTGNGSCTGSGTYDHDHVVKHMMNGDQGEMISSGTWNSGQPVTRALNYIVPVSPQVADPQNCEFKYFCLSAGFKYFYKQLRSAIVENFCYRSLRNPKSKYYSG